MVSYALLSPKVLNNMSKPCSPRYYKYKVWNMSLWHPSIFFFLSEEKSTNTGLYGKTFKVTVLAILALFLRKITTGETRDVRHYLAKSYHIPTPVFPFTFKYCKKNSVGICLHSFGVPAAPGTSTHDYKLSSFRSTVFYLALPLTPQCNFQLHMFCERIAK